MFFSPAFFERCVISPCLVSWLPLTLGPLCRQRPSIRAGSHARHPILSASFDESRKACGRRPHLSDGFCTLWPGNVTGRLHQHQDPGVTQHRNTAYASFEFRPLRYYPGLSRKRHSAMSNLRATATIPRRLKRLPPLYIHQSARETNNSGHSPAVVNAANSRPTPWSSSAYADSPTW